MNSWELFSEWMEKSGFFQGELNRNQDLFDDIGWDDLDYVEISQFLTEKLDFLIYDYEICESITVDELIKTIDKLCEFHFK